MDLSPESITARLQEAATAELGTPVGYMLMNERGEPARGNHFPPQFRNLHQGIKVFKDLGQVRRAVTEARGWYFDRDPSLTKGWLAYPVYANPSQAISFDEYKSKGELLDES